MFWKKKRHCFFCPSEKLVYQNGFYEYGGVWVGLCEEHNNKENREDVYSWASLEVRRRKVEEIIKSGVK